MRFEFSEGGSNKFWDIERAGAKLTIKFGKLGAAGQTQLKTFGSDAEAIAAHDKLVAEKTKKGYVAVGGAKAKAKAIPAPVAAPASAPQLGHVTGGIKPTALSLTKLHDDSIHRIVIRDRMALATGNSCLATSNGKKLHRRDSPGVSYGLFDLDGKFYSLGGPFAVTIDEGASWKYPKMPPHSYIFALAVDPAGQWWMGCDGGMVLTSDRADRGWKVAPFKTGGKVLCILPLDGKLLLVGAGCGEWDGSKYRPLKGFKKGDVVTRITEAPSGALIAVGDRGIAYRSTDRGKTFTAVKSGVDVDLEDCAWVAGALFVVGGQGVLLRSTDEGKTYKKLPTGAQKLWTIASWGDGALLGGDSGVYALAAPNDTYWKGAADRFVPPPPQLDAAFAPSPGNPKREAQYKALLAAAVAEHDKLAAPLRAKRPADPNPKLAQTLDEAAEGADHVYADWLSDQGDPRGELAQVQLRLAKDPKNKELKKLEKKLLATHREALLGKLAEVEPMLELEWHAGFITKARIAAVRNDDFDDEDGEAGEEKQELPSVEKVLGWLLDSPSGRFLRDLTIGIVILDDENTYNGVAKVIGSRYLPSLRALFLGDFTYEDTELNWSTLGNLEPMWPALPNLEQLTLRSGSMKLGSIVLPRLRSFTVITGGMDAKAARAIAAARWPSLETLSLQIGPEGSTDVKVKDLQPILDGTSLPRLTHLGITNFNHTGELLEPLAHSQILPQLTELDLKMGTLGDEHATKLFALQKGFAHLTKLDVHDNYLTSEGKAVLKRAKLAFHFGEQREDEGWGERYASTYE